MLFPSITFLYFFLPITLAVYGLTPQKGKNAVLFGAGILFYFWGEPAYSFLLLVLVLEGYVCGRWIAAVSDRKKLCKLILWGSVAVPLLALAYFKYSGAAALPLGISFYTFQIISYLVDVYRRDVEPENSLVDFGAYVTMFPQLVAGPIVRYDAIRPQLKGTRRGIEKLAAGQRRFLCGLAKKLLIGDVLGELVAKLDGLEGKTALLYWGLAVAYVLQLYYDFSGYSDMAIGLGKMLGFDFPENFDYPLIAKSITEFWRRWHMTLGGWLRDYVYIPLGGNRVGRVRFVWNVMLVWTLSGIWHGAGWNFALWGAYFGVFLVLERAVRSMTARHRFTGRLASFLAHGYALVVITVSFVIFRVEDMGELSNCLLGMLGMGNSPAGDTVSREIGIYEMKSYGMLLLLAAVGATPLVKRTAGKLGIRIKELAGARVAAIGELFGNLLLLLLVTAFLLGSTVHPFLYFRF
ncbi:MAG: MBOAT family O-acyltransferase [Roseburia sp.]